MSNDISIHISAPAEGYDDKHQVNPEEFEGLLALIALNVSSKGSPYVMWRYEIA
jgi:hypothetical protein